MRLGKYLIGLAASSMVSDYYNSWDRCPQPPNPYVLCACYSPTNAALHVMLDATYGPHLVSDVANSCTQFKSH